VTLSDGVVAVDARMMTGRPGLFAGGDMVPADRTVTTGVGRGKLAARNIDAWLRSEAYAHPLRPGLAELDRLNTWYYADAPHEGRLNSVQPPFVTAYGRSWVTIASRDL
jgi:hypothetical protein